VDEADAFMKCDPDWNHLTQHVFDSHWLPRHAAAFGCLQYLVRRCKVTSRATSSCMSRHAHSLPQRPVAAAASGMASALAGPQHPLCALAPGCGPRHSH
jgi:hypothetical protein